MPLSSCSTIRQSGGFDLLISDYAMPGFSGDRAGPRRAQAVADLPVLLITGYSDLVGRARARARLGTGCKNRFGEPILREQVGRLVL